MQQTERFLQYLESEKRSSAHTLTAYRNDLQQFLDFLGSSEEGVLQLVKPRLIRSWVVALSEAGRSPRTIHRKISALKMFFRHLQIEGVIESNPAALVNLPKIPKRLPVFVKDEAMVQLLDRTDFGSDFEGLRNKLILELFYDTGMRLSELVALRVRDFDLSRGLVKVRGKRNKERLIPLTAELKRLLLLYVEVRRETFGALEDSALFLTVKGEAVYHRLVYRIVHAALTQVSTQQKRSPHVLRHSFATVLLNRGADLNAIKELLGHANLNATQIYTHNTFEKLNAIYKQAHPRA
ncbi:tyrosine-type recombinase/integrase [Geofilum rhodophaeum]|uniref:tyrosine-type recombinase/integrase n=1 Tax=Geofilum rhodophaeum TaxID=1965019 RepID=UPI000B523C83|nr:tyrosine-type recombinase/integrase [Geofilum rhodophaeum]